MTIIGGRVVRHGLLDALIVTSKSLQHGLKLVRHRAFGVRTVPKPGPINEDGSLRILVVSDIHGNRAALEAIDEPHDLCVCLGDLVDYGPDPRGCIAWAMRQTHYAVRGNHDHGLVQDVAVLGMRGYRFLTRVTRQGVEESLDPDERHFLASLPLTARFTLDGIRFLLVHATPRDPLDEYVPADPESWAARCQGVEADFVLVGHTHQQFQFVLGPPSSRRLTVVNPGSVGLPRDGDPRAAYAVIDQGKVILKRIEYPIDRTIQEIEVRPWPDRAKWMLAENLRIGRLPAIALQQPDI